jgi:hypothetical protein
VRRRGRDRGRHRLMRHVDRPAPGRLVSRGLRLLAAGRPTGLLTAGRRTGLLTVTGLLTASRGAAVLLIGLFQGDLFPDGLVFPRGLLISQFLAGRLAGPSFPAGRLASPCFLAGRVASPRFLIGRVAARFLAGRLAGPRSLIVRLARPHLLGWRLLIGGLMIGGLTIGRLRSGGFVIAQRGRASHVRGWPGSPGCWVSGNSRRRPGRWFRRSC